jgi:hypothetical protein
MRQRVTAAARCDYFLIRRANIPKRPRPIPNIGRVIDASGTDEPGI